MRAPQRFLFAGGLLAGAIALGCQAPVPTEPAARAPRVLTHVGAMSLDADTDIALQFNQPCAEGQPGYALKALDSRIHHIVVTVNGPGLPAGGLPVRVERADFGTGCSLTKQLLDLLPGTYTLTMIGYDAADIGVMREAQPQDIVVVKNQTAQVTLKCDFDKGSLDVLIDCCPATPTPTATPVPTPTPPADLTDGDIGTTTGFTVDDLGRVYVYGFDPGFNFASPNGHIGTEGRAVRVTGPQVESTWINAMPVLSEGEFLVTRTAGAITGRKFLAASTISGFGYSNRFVELDLDVPSQSRILVKNVDQIAPFGATTLDGNSNLLFTLQYSNYPFANAFNIYRVAGPAYDISPFVHVHAPPYHNVASPVPSPGSGPTPIPLRKPYALSWDAAAGHVVYSSSAGILRGSDPDPHAHPTTDVQLPSGELAFGMVLLEGATPSYLFTKFDTRSVFFAPAGAPASGPIATAVAFDYGFPWRIERGLDGFVYVLLRDEAQGGGDQREVSKYRIVKTRLNADNTLTPLAVVVNKMPAGSPASFPSPAPTP